MNDHLGKRNVQPTTIPCVVNLQFPTVHQTPSIESNITKASLQDRSKEQPSSLCEWNSRLQRQDKSPTKAQKSSRRPVLQCP